MQTGSYLLDGDGGISILLPETDNLQQQQEAEQDVETLVIANPPAGSSISIDDQLVAAPGPDWPAPAAEGSVAAAIAATDALAASMTYLGCIVAEQSVMAGDTVSLINDVPTAEQCCQACRANPQCNVWSWCGSAQGCSYQDFSADVNLSAQQCEQPQQSPSPSFLPAWAPHAACWPLGLPLKLVLRATSSSHCCVRNKQHERPACSRCCQLGAADLLLPLSSLFPSSSLFCSADPSASPSSTLTHFMQAGC
jgi:hypothetical protein